MKTRAEIEKDLENSKEERAKAQLASDYTAYKWWDGYVTAIEWVLLGEADEQPAESEGE